MASSNHLEALAKIVLSNLENQQDWANLTIHSESSKPRPLITGMPPRRMYVHPDEQIEIIKAEKVKGERIPQPSELEWVLPVHLAEKMSLKAFAAVFDSLEAVPPGTEIDESDDEEWKKWRGSKRGKRIMLAIVSDDSTVVYYMMHDGIVKPRQN